MDRRDRDHPESQSTIPLIPERFERLEKNPVKKNPLLWETLSISINGSQSANGAHQIKRTSPWLLLFLPLQEDLAHQVGLEVQGGPDLPLVRSHQSVPKMTKLEISTRVLRRLYFK